MTSSPTATPTRAATPSRATTTRTVNQGADPAVAPSDGSFIVACPWAYFEGALVPFEQATVSIATHSLHYGTAVFEGIRAYRQA
ncbi:MAG TPA: hypothetical protein VJ506_11650, partial [Candidatus Limnocylindrales bacterium]|nr:hypothetical protein [Candidatus Limnocylindrales bacterium]